MDPRIDDPDWLRSAYQMMTEKQIGEVLACARSTVNKRLKTFGIPRRPRGHHFAGMPKPEAQKAKMADARRAYWADRPDRTEHRLKISAAKTKHGISANGYQRVYVLGRGSVHLHRLVAEQMIGRPLLPDEVVHHKDGDRLNNHPDNLEIVSPADHAKAHCQSRRRDAAGRLLPNCP